MKDGKHWPWIIVGALVTNCLGVGLLVYFANSDPSHHVEANYYSKALAWDDTMAQRRRNAKLGWRLSTRVSATKAGMKVETTLFDGTGAVLTGAHVDVVAFHRARAGQRFRVALTDAGDGHYGVVVPSERAGMWELHYSATHADKLFTAKRVVKLGASSGAP